jgi:hypothetical protein
MTSLARIVPLVVIAAIVFSAAPLRAADDRSPEERRVDEAVVRALQFLAQEQRPSGAWRIDAYGESTAATSLAVMSFLAAGHVPGEGPYGERITRGVDWVLDHQQPDDMLAIPHQSHGPMYSHGISTLMLAEVVGMLDEARAERCREVLQKAVRLILKGQEVPKANGHEGGWRYSPTSRDSDLSVTGWQLLALRAAKDVGCDVPADNIERAVEYVKRCASHGGFTYQPGQHPTAVRTGTGILCLEVAGEHQCDETMSGADWLLERPLRWDEGHFFYGVYYCTVGMFKVGGEHWESTRDQINGLLLDRQHLDGSWTNQREGTYGKVYCTSMCVLALAIDYRYLPIYQR